MDNAESRRGQLAWYKNDGVGILAVNDGILLESSIYSILRKYFSNHAGYVPLTEIFHDITFKTSLGQMLDGMCMKDGRPDLEKFSMKRFVKVNIYIIYQR